LGAVGFGVREVDASLTGEVFLLGFGYFPEDLDVLHIVVVLLGELLDEFLEAEGQLYAVILEAYGIDEGKRL
jgi:hypothetical protein